MTPLEQLDKDLADAARKYVDATGERFLQPSFNFVDATTFGDVKPKYRFAHVEIEEVRTVQGF